MSIGNGIPGIHEVISTTISGVLDVQSLKKEKKKKRSTIFFFGPMSVLKCYEHHILPSGRILDISNQPDPVWLTGQGIESFQKL